MLTGNQATNMKRHIEKKHPEKYFEIQMVNEENTSMNLNRKLMRLKIDHSEDLLWEGCVELIASGGLPYSFIMHNGFKKIIKPIVDAIKPENQFNVANLKVKVMNTAESIKEKIKKEMNGRLISLKIDAVTRHSRSLLGINVQFASESKMVTYTLAVKELKECHTGVYIKQIILNSLKEFDVSLNQIYTITSDNGRNMIKATKELQLDCEKSM